MSFMSAVRDELVEALETIDGIRVYDDPGAVVDPPAVLVGPPSLTWEAMCNSPTSARFLVYVIAASDERALENLWTWLEKVTNALDEVDDSVVIRADPGTFNAGGVELPTYEIQVEVSLR